jgi:F-box protein 9
VTSGAEPRGTQPDAADVTEEGEVERGKTLAPQSYGELAANLRSLSLAREEEDLFLPEPPKEPSSALELFEQAVKKEAQGNLGDSLSLYRKAYKVTYLAV